MAKGKSKDANPDQEQEEVLLTGSIDSEQEERDGNRESQAENQEGESGKSNKPKPLTRIRRTPNGGVLPPLRPLDEIVQYSIEHTDLQKIAPKEKATKQWHSPREISLFLENLGVIKGVNEPNTFSAITLLFNKGAANKGAPKELSVEVTGITFTKGDIEYVYYNMFGNKHIRRLAESLSSEIGNYSQRHKLSGDLAKRINTRLIQKKEAILTANEAAWASSFHQGNDNLSRVSDRIAQLLAEDYAERFSTKVKNNQNKKSQSKGNAQKGKAQPSDTTKSAKKGKSDGGKNK